MFFSKSLGSKYFCSKKCPKINDLQFSERKKLQILILTFGHKFDRYIAKDTLIEFLLSISLHDLLDSYKGKGKNGT